MSQEKCFPISYVCITQVEKFSSKFHLESVC